ncbi:MAG: InlB B-repeat-containing protein, partial [Lachnospiraceae bacterium]
MRKKKWLAWLLITAMAANHAGAAFAATDESTPVKTKTAQETATPSNSDKEIADNEEADIQDIDQDTATPSDSNKIAKSNQDDQENEVVLTDSYELPWTDLVDVPDLFSGEAYILEDEIGTVYFDEEGAVSVPGGFYGDQLINQKAADIYDFLYDYYEGVLYENEEPSQTEVNPYGADNVLLTYTVDSKDELSSLLSEVKEEMGYYGTQAYYAFLYDYPEMFWKLPLSMQYNLTANGNDEAGWTAAITLTLELSVSETKDEIQAMSVELKNVIENIMASCLESSGYRDILMSAHDYIANIADYDDTLSRTYAYSPYGVLVEGLGVCESYSKALKWICDELDIPNVLIVGDGVTSNGTDAHMWNYVQMDDDCWYAVDLTWDDQDTGIQYEYFLAGADSLGFNEERFAESHVEKYISVLLNQTLGDSAYFAYPELNAESYDSEIASDEAVVIPDENLKQALLRSSYNADGDEEMSVSEMEAIVDLDDDTLVNQNIRSLKGLETAVNLTVISLNGNEGLQNIDALSQLSKLEKIKLNETGITDFSPLKNLPNLKRLNALANGVTNEDLEVLNEFPALKKLNLSSNNITDITAIASLNLNEVILGNNPVSVIPENVQWNSEAFFTENNDGTFTPAVIFAGASLTADDLTQSKFIHADVYTTDQWTDWVTANTNADLFAPVTDLTWSEEYPGWAHYTTIGAVNSVVWVYKNGEFEGEIVGEKSWADLRELINEDGAAYTYRAAARLVSNAKFDENSEPCLSDYSEPYYYEMPAEKLAVATDLAIDSNGVMSWSGMAEKPYANDYGKLYVVYIYDGKAADGDSYLKSYKTDNASLSIDYPSSPSGTWKFRVRTLGDQINYANSELSEFSTVWTAHAENEYTIEYVLDGGINSEANPSVYTPESDTIILEAAAKEGYLFAGWYTEADFQNNVTEIPKGTTGNITLYAKWSNEGWYEDENGNWFYYTDYANGIYLTSQWLELNGARYYLQEDGTRKTGWQKWEDGRWSYFTSKGKAKWSITFKPTIINGEYYAFDSECYMLYGWVYSPENRTVTEPEDWKIADYYFGGPNDGSQKTGWKKINVYGGWKNETGKADHFFYFDPESNGQKTIGWITLEELTYYFNNTGAMCEGLSEIDGQLYYFDPSDGHMLTSTEVTLEDGTVYVIDENGVAVAGNPAPVIIRQPQDVECEPGTTISFTVEAEGDGLTYQWEYSKDGGITWATPSVSSSRTKTYKIGPTAKSMNGRVVRCTITDTNGKTTISDTAILTVKNKLAITKQPQDVACEAGAGATFTIEAAGDDL